MGNALSWRHFILIWTGSVFRLYVDGTQIGSDIQASYSTSGNLYLYLNSVQRYTSETKGGKFAALRLYNRVLSDSEIALLAAEFTPMSN